MHLTKMPSMKRALRSALVAALVLLAACGDSGPDGAGESAGENDGKTTVVVKDIAFKPERISVEVGETVTWSFQDRGIPHNVVADDGSFKSDLKDSGTFEHTFEKPGSFSYTCTVHPGMNGSVKVG